MILNDFSFNLLLQSRAEQTGLVSRLFLTQNFGMKEVSKIDVYNLLCPESILSTYN